MQPNPETSLSKFIKFMMPRINYKTAKLVSTWPEQSSLVANMHQEASRKVAEQTQDYVKEVRRKVDERRPGSTAFNRTTKPSKLSRVVLNQTGTSTRKMTWLCSTVITYTKKKECHVLNICRRTVRTQVSTGNHWWQGIYKTEFQNMAPDDGVNRR